MLAVLAAAGLVLGPRAWGHLRAASFLLRFADPQTQSSLARLGKHPIEVSPLALEATGRPVAAKLYRPRGVERPPGIVLVHGIHYLGIEEPRLTRFARCFAESGFAVLTPELEELADYRVDPRSIETIGRAIEELRRVAGDGRPVGLVGLSFAGGLSLLAAADARWADQVGFVLAVGAHADLGRVLRFFASDQIVRPDGSVERLQAHDYGALVLVYANAESFFAPAEIPEARRVLRLWLNDRHEEARRSARALPDPLRETILSLFDRRLASLTAQLPATLEEIAPALGAVSPAGHLGGLKAPVFLLHGAGDTVIPASESLWLAQEVPSRALREVLISPALVHVELGQVSLSDRWDLVALIARVFAAAGR